MFDCTLWYLWFYLNTTSSFFLLWSKIWNWEINFQYSPLLNFGNLSPMPVVVWNSCPSINCIASSGPLIRSKGRKPVAVPIVICHRQCFSSSWHYCNGCTAGGLLEKFVKEQCPGCDGMTEKSASFLIRCTKIAPPVYECSKEKRRLTTCRWAWWCRREFLQDTFP